MKKWFLVFSILILAGCNNKINKNLNDNNITFNAKINKPTLVSIDSVNPTSIRLFWLPASGNNVEYKVYVSKDKNFIPNNKNFKISTHNLNTIIKDLKPNTKYYALVVANDNFAKNLIICQFIQRLLNLSLNK